MCHAKNQFCNMNRFVLILLLSLFNFVGAYAYTNTRQTSGYPMRTALTQREPDEKDIKRAASYCETAQKIIRMLLPALLPALFRKGLCICPDSSFQDAN